MLATVYPFELSAFHVHTNSAEKLKLMGSRKDLACFSLLFLLLLMLLEAATSADGGSPRFSSFKTKPTSAELSPLKSNASSDGGDKDGALLGDEKRRVRTGPNPLHNR